MVWKCDREPARDADIGPTPPPSDAYLDAWLAARGMKLTPEQEALVEPVASHLAARNGGVWAVFSGSRKEKYRKTARAIIPIIWQHAAAVEREACAKEAEWQAAQPVCLDCPRFEPNVSCNLIADAIRARSNDDA